MFKVQEASDLDLINKIKDKSCDQSFLEIFERHKKIYYNVCSFYTRGKSIITYDELLKDSYYVVNWAIQKYDHSKNTKFPTFLYIYSRCHCLNKIKHATEKSKEVTYENKDIDFFANSDGESSPDVYKDKHVKEEVFSILNKMDDQRIEKIFRMRFYGDKEESKWKNISSKLNLTPQRVYMLYNKGRSHLIKKLDQ